MNTQLAKEIFQERMPDFFSDYLMGAGSRQKLRVADLAELLEMKLPLRELLLRPWLPKAGLAMIHAGTGIGKTHLSLNIAYAVASGGAFLGWEADEPHGVLFVDGEMPATALQERLVLINKMNGELCAPNQLKIITPDLQDMCLPDLATPEGQELVDDCITDDTSLIILDNLSSLIQSGKENDADSWQPIQSWLLALRRRGKSVLLIHHAAKSGVQRGTSKRADVLDTVIRLERPEGCTQDQGARFNVHFEKSRGFFGDDAKSFEAHLKKDRDGNACWATNVIKEKTFDAVVRLLNEGLSQEKIAKELKLNPSSISRHAQKAKDKCLLKLSGEINNG